MIKRILGGRNHRIVALKRALTIITLSPIIILSPIISLCRRARAFEEIQQRLPPSPEGYMPGLQTCVHLPNKRRSQGSTLKGKKQLGARYLTLKRSPTPGRGATAPAGKFTVVTAGWPPASSERARRGCGTPPRTPAPGRQGSESPRPLLSFFGTPPSPAHPTFPSRSWKHTPHTSALRPSSSPASPSEDAAPVASSRRRPLCGWEAGRGRGRGGGAGSAGGGATCRPPRGGGCGLGVVGKGVVCFLARSSQRSCGPAKSLCRQVGRGARAPGGGRGRQ